MLRSMPLMWMLAAMLATHAPGDDAVVHPSVWRDLDARSGALVWVLFRDKGVDDVERAVLELERTYDPRAIERRTLRRTRPGLFDATDLPVSARYEAEVAALTSTVRARSRWLNGVSAFATRNEVESLSRLAFVERIQPVRRGEIVDMSAISDGGDQLGGGFYGISQEELEAVNLIAVHQDGFTGEGVVIGVLDTGFLRTHEAFNEPGHELEVVAEYDFINDDPDTAPEDGDDPEQHVHGTLILGVMAGYKPGTFVGAAFDASYILCKTEDVTDEYPAEEDYYVEGLEFIEANGGDVATSSLGYIDWYTQEDLDGMTAVTTIGVNIATGNGVHCCTAAGNGGHDQDPLTSHLIAPGDAFDVFTVGAVNIFGEEGGFSADGPTADKRLKPEILAIGDVAPTISASDDHGYTDASGTSMATPQLAGIVACLAEAGPHWSVRRLREAIMFTGTDYVRDGHPDPLYVRGYGIADAAAALDRGGPSPAELTGFAMRTGTVLSGGLAELLASDDARLRTRSGFGMTFVDLHKMEMTVAASSKSESPATLDLAVESRINQPNGVARLRLRDQDTGQFVLVAQYAVNSSESVHRVTDLGASVFVGDDGVIELEIRHVVVVPVFAFQFESFIDHVECLVD